MNDKITFQEINNLLKKYPNDPFLKGVKKDMERKSFWEKIVSGKNTTS